MRTPFVVLALALLTSSAAAVELEELWIIEGFASPESIAVSEDGSTLYVSNVAGEAGDRDGEGFISRVSPEGEVLELRWVEGFNAPKGLDISGDQLVVSDIDAVAVIDIATATIVERIEFPEAVFLNDVEVLSDGSVLVSDSGAARIYHVEDGAISTYTEGEWLAGVNGLLQEGDQLLISTMDTHSLFAFDPATGEHQVLASDVGNGDGIAILEGGAYLVSEWPGRLFHVSADGTTTTILDTREAPYFINDFNLVGDTLFVPHWQPGAVSAYRVTQ